MSNGALTLSTAFVTLTSVMPYTLALYLRFLPRFWPWQGWAVFQLRETLGRWYASIEVLKIEYWAAAPLSPRLLSS